MRVPAGRIMWQQLAVKPPSSPPLRIHDPTSIAEAPSPSAELWLLFAEASTISNSRCDNNRSAEHISPRNSRTSPPLAGPVTVLGSAGDGGGSGRELDVDVGVGVGVGVGCAECCLLSLFSSPVVRPSGILPIQVNSSHHFCSECRFFVNR